MFAASVSFCGAALCLRVQAQSSREDARRSCVECSAHADGFRRAPEPGSLALTSTFLGLRVLIRIFAKELVGVAAALQARLQLLRQQAEQLCFLPGAAAATKLSICISKEALLASFIMRTLSKGAEQYDVSDILKNLHDAGSVAAEGPKDLTLWSYRAQLLQHVADKTLAFDPPLRGKEIPWHRR